MLEPFPLTMAVATADAGKRLDQFLVTRMQSVSRARMQQLISEEKVLVNDAPAKASLKLRGGETVKVLGEAERAPLRHHELERVADGRRIKGAQRLEALGIGMVGHRGVLQGGEVGRVALWAMAPRGKGFSPGREAASGVLKELDTELTRGIPAHHA